MRLLYPSAIGMGLVVSLAAAAGGPAPIGIQELHRLDRLPLLRSSIQVGSVSSYDRTGGNDDGFSGKYSFVRKESEGLVLADLKGPGVIYRIWTPTPTDDLLEFLFDGESRPRMELKFRDLFQGKHPAFPSPLVGAGGGGYYCYVPLPFAQQCVVRLRSTNVQFYQINYALYPNKSQVQTFDPQGSRAYFDEVEKACALFRRAGGDISSITATPGDRIKTSKRQFKVSPHSTRRIFESRKGGRIVGLRIGPADAIAGKARDLVLRISFDGEPAVLCPLGDFFGYGWGEPAMRSLLVGTAGGTNYCYFPMPFEKQAIVEIVSQRAADVELFVEVQSTARARQAGEGRFQAVWRRENPTKSGEPFTFLDVAGRGHLVGVALQAQGFESGKTPFFEGDDETTIDGETTVRGTGSEDFFNGGWYDVPERWDQRISFPLSGCLGYAKHLGRTGGYRFFIGDACVYRRGLRQTIEHAGEKNNIPTDYSGVAYFYSEQPVPVPAELPPLKERAVVDLREIIFPAGGQIPTAAWSYEGAGMMRKRLRLDGEDIPYLSFVGEGEYWFGPHFLWQTVEVPVAGRYAIYIEAVKGPAQARVQLFRNEVPLGDAVDLYAESPSKSGRLLLGAIDLAAGRNNLMLKLTGKNERSTAFGLDLIALICARQ